MKRIFVTALALLMLLSGCAAETAYVPTGNGLDGAVSTRPSDDTQVQEQPLALAYNPQKPLNPYICADHTNKLLFSLLYQGLFSVDSNYQVEPQLCKSYAVSQDMKTYTFYLEDATFSDGMSLTVDDVIASLEAARSNTVYSGRLYNVESISATTDGGVQIQLRTAYENFPLLLNIPIVKASQVSVDSPEGTGPYTLESTSQGFELWRRRGWWCRATLPIDGQKIPLVEVQSTKEIRDGFELGNIGVVCANPGADSYVDFRNNYDLWDCENGIFLYLGCRAKSKVFSNEIVRQALTHAIDRTALVQEYYRTFALAATLPASPASPYYNQALAQQYGYDADKLTAALVQEGLDGSTITLLVNKDDGRRVKVANAIATMLEQCSLTVTVKALSGDSYTSALRNGGYDLYLGQTMLSPNMDLSAFFDKSGALNYGGMSDTAISSLCKDALANSGNYDTLHQAVMKDAMLCPVAFLSYAVYGRSDLLEDLSPARDHIFYYSLGKTMEEALITE